MATILCSMHRSTRASELLRRGNVVREMSTMAIEHFGPVLTLESGNVALSYAHGKGWPLKQV